MSVSETSNEYIDVPEPPPLSLVKKILFVVAGSVLSPLYFLAAYYYPTPGLSFRWQSARMGLRLLPKIRDKSLLRDAYNLLFFPMDSTRYFELCLLWQYLAPLSPISGNYLDISSPRLFPLALLLNNPKLHGTLINPHLNDLDATRTLARALNFSNQCDFLGHPIDAAPLATASFDLISSISVVEHIPQDADAVARIWSLLKPGGKLLLTVPCASVSFEQFIDKNYYGLLKSDSRGYVFWQRYYDEAALESRIFNITGLPKRLSIYGEIEKGTFSRNAVHKRASRTYPFWREPLFMGRGFKYFDSIQALPGEGVIAMEFLKP
jgi:SAM-dependent methyltransferase